MALPGEDTPDVLRPLRHPLAMHSVRGHRQLHPPVRTVVSFGSSQDSKRALRTIRPNSPGIRAHYEQMSEFERGRIIEPKEAGWTNRRIAHHMGRSDVAIRRCWQEWVENGSVMMAAVDLGPQQIGSTD
ncbi:hypothetical protein TNCV_3654561 [Trichonephila clavipes]|nr:hypothetical protein TNCV_3654561 [Trichonephila clavipes]